MRSRIFLSCGQWKGTDEPGIASEIADGLRQLGFDCYVAVADQSPLGLRENIFRNLENSEYFLFIDFKREKLGSKEGKTDICRGSLFSHQELALASYLEKPVLIFQERGVEERHGMLNCFHVNPTFFEDRSTLAKLVVSQVKAKLEAGEWSPGWQGSLTLHIPDSPFADAHEKSLSGPVIRFFHGTVRNNHRSKMALNCVILLESISQVDGPPATKAEPIEVKWAGSTLPSVAVAPQSERRFDAFKVRVEDPECINFNVPWCDSSYYRPLIPYKGLFDLTFCVYSSNFPASRQKFFVQNLGGLSDIRFEHR